MNRLPGTSRGTPRGTSRATDSLAAGLAAVLLAAGPLAAQATWVCALGSYVECEPGNVCVDEPAQGAADAPVFLTIDLDGREIRATETRFAHRTAPILQSERSAGRLVLAGLQDGRGWSISVAEDTGAMSFAISDPEVAILISGRCIPPDIIGS